MVELGQDLFVTAVAASAMAVIGRRLVGAVRAPKSGQPACPSCASGSAACIKPIAKRHAPAEVQPLTLVRKL